MAADFIVPKPCTNAAAFCRLDRSLMEALVSGHHAGRMLLAASALLFAGSTCYGFVFGLWRAPLQGFYSALKMPVLMLSVALVSGTINGMFAQVIGARLSFQQVFLSILISMAITSALLGALSPIVLVFVTQATPNTISAYGALLASHTVLIGCCGIIGTARLYNLLVEVTDSRRIAGQVLLSWVLVSGLVGCEIAWVFSPFLARPDIPIPFINPNAFNTNFFEYLWQAMGGELV